MEYMGAGAERVVVFVDYHNVHGWARRLFQPVNAHPAVGHVDPLRLGQLLVNRRPRTSALAGVRVYRGRRSPDHRVTRWWCGGWTGWGVRCGT